MYILFNTHTQLYESENISVLDIHGEQFSALVKFRGIEAIQRDVNLRVSDQCMIKRARFTVLTQIKGVIASAPDFQVKVTRNRDFNT